MITYEHLKKGMRNAYISFGISYGIMDIYMLVSMKDGIVLVMKHFYLNPKLQQKWMM